MKNIYEIVIKDIEENFKNSNYSTNQLLQNTQLEKKDVREVIKSKTDRALSNYIRFYRLNHAQKLLKKGDKNISEIAYDSGFSSLSYFSKSFKDEFGYSPNTSLNNLKFTRKFRSSMISIIQNKKYLSILSYSVLFIIILVLLLPNVSFTDNSDKLNRDSMYEEYSKLNNISIKELKINDTLFLNDGITSYEISWRLNSLYDWDKLKKITDSSFLFSKEMRGVVDILLEKEGSESSKFRARARSLVRDYYSINLDVKFNDDGIYFPGRNVYLPNTTYGKSHESITLSPFYIDKYEVSNKEYKEFVDNNGYYNREYWPDKIVYESRQIPFDSVKYLFIDKAKFPGPKDWMEGNYEYGKDLFPVSGISWYEASAYAKFRKKSLPSVAQWFYAFDRSNPDELLNNANINSYNFTKSRLESQSENFYGLFDMAGNVREWVKNSILSEDKRGILGGSFADDTYVAFDFFSQNSWDRSSYNGFRLVKNIRKENSGEIFYSRQKERNFYDNYKTTNKEWGLIKSLFLYDKDLIITEAIETHNKVTDREYYCKKSEIDYGSTTKMPIHHLTLFPEKKSKKAIIYFPGSNALFQNDLQYPDFFNKILKSGIDIIYPEYLSTYSRKDGLKTDIGDTSMNYRDHLITWVKETRFAVDYAVENNLEPHYLGISWGGQVGVNILAIEDRFKTGVLIVGGISLDDVRDEIQPEKYASRIKTPTLLLNGRYDYYFPFKTSQQPLYNLINVDKDLKRHVVVEQAHNVPNHIIISETLNWINNKALKKQ